MQRGAVDHRDAGRAVEVERVRDFHDALRGNGDFLARRAEAAIAEHAVACRESRYAGADAFDNAGELGSRRERERRLDLIFARDDQRVEEVQRRGLDGDHDLAFARHRVGKVRDLKIIGAAEASTQNGFHPGHLKVRERGKSRVGNAGFACPNAFTLPISPGISMTSGAWGESMKTNACTFPLALAVLTGLLTVAFAQGNPPAKQKAPAAKSEPKQGKQAAPPPPAPGGGGQPTLLGQFGEWGSYTANSGGQKICYALAKPTSSATEPANRPRDPAYTFVSTRPTENVRNEISIVMGYPVKPGSEATVDI